MRKRVIPTVFATTKEQFDKRFKRLVKVANSIQIDFMDGKLVPASSMSLSDIPDLHSYMPHFEAHLMVADPESWIARVAVKGFQKCIIHVEACKNVHSTVMLIQRIKELGMKPMLAINPSTPLKSLDPYIKLVSGILVMGVNPGKEHQSLAKNTAKRISTLKKSHHSLFVQVDGGVNDKTLPSLVSAGVDSVNSGSFVSDARDPQASLHLLEKMFRKRR